MDSGLTANATDAVVMPHFGQWQQRIILVNSARIAVREWMVTEMAEFKKIIKEYKRMCKSYVNCSDGCPFCHTTCKYELIEYPDEAEKIIMQWLAKNPAKTNGKKFEEVFGRSPYMKFQSYEDMKQWIESEYEG